MKKTLLFGCLTTLLMSPAFAEMMEQKPLVLSDPVYIPVDIYADESVRISSAEEIKTAFADFITKQMSLGQLFDVTQIKVTPQDNNFIITLPATEKIISSDTENQENKTISLSEKNILLTYAGGFNGHAQYRIDSVLDTLQSLIREIVPEVSLAAEKSTSKMLWVPHYNLVSKNSQNIQNMKLNIPNILDLTIGSVVSDSLSRPSLSENKMDRSDALDLQDMKISAEGIAISIPKVSIQNTISGSPLSTSSVQQFISSEKAEFNMNVPMIIVMPEGGENMGSLALSTQALYQDEYPSGAIHLEAKLDKVTLNKMLIPLPEIFLPSEVSLNIDVKNVQKEDLNLLFNQDEKITQEERQLALQKIMSKAFVQLNQLNVKNADAGISVSGTLYALQKEIGLPQPQADLTVVITNLDKISPEPKVDEKQCAETKAFFLTNADIDKETSDMVIQTACQPRGGVLDTLRPYLAPEKRVVNQDGTTTDTLSVVLKNNVLTVNGKEVQ